MSIPRNSLDTRRWLFQEFDDEQRLSITTFYSLSRFASSAIFRSPDETFERLAAHIRVSPNLASIVNELVAASASEAEVSVAVLQMFFYQDFLLDLASMNADDLLSVMHDEVKEGRITFPQSYGRELYDRFNEVFSLNRAYYLSGDDLERLVGDQPSACYQVGSLLSGPFGIIKSGCSRYLAPTLSLPLWHCADPGCNYLHEVELRPSASSLVRLRKSLRARLEEEVGPASEWRWAVHAVLLNNPTLNGRDYVDVPVLVAEAFHGNDRTNILSSLLRSELGQELKEAIKKARPALDTARIQPERLAAALEPGEQLQVIMIAPDDIIAHTIDGLVLDHIIDVPYSEVRRTKREIGKVFRDDSRTAVSRLGIRSDQRDPVARMATSIWSAYEKCDEVNDLEWRCRGRTAVPNVSSPLEYIHTHHPEDVIRDLVLPSRDVTLALASEFGLGAPSSADQETLVSRFLWRMGFDIPLYDRRLEKAKEHLVSFRAKVIACSDRPDEEEREGLRSAGVNLYVALENILEELLAFNVWLLLSDHFSESKFIYRKSDALYVVADQITSGNEDNSAPFVWDKSGGNTLGCTMYYLRVAADLFNKLVLSDRERFLRHRQEMPHYQGQRFALRHTSLWADTLDIELKRFSTAFSEVVRIFERAQIPATRNSLDHHRDAANFPSPADLLARTSLLSEGLDQILHQRFFPVPLWLEKTSKDNYGRIEYTFATGDEAKIRLYGPSILLGIKAPKFSEPFVLPFGNLLGYSKSDLIFSIEANSSFSRYWKNYPKRQNITPRRSPVVDEANVSS